MTTIAYRAGVIAADGRVCDRDAIVSEEMCKIVKAGPILGGAEGLVEFGWRFRSWVRCGCVGNPPEPDEDSVAMLVLPDGRALFIVDSGVELWRAPYYALGSGRRFALGAMAAGKSAEQAVRLAAKHDVNTGGRIQVLRH